MTCDRDLLRTAQRTIQQSVIAAIVVLGITTIHANAAEARFIPLPPDFVPAEISGDGSVIVGWINLPDCPSSQCNPEPALWTEAGGLERLGFVRDDHDWAQALDVSADGSVIVGWGATGGEPNLEAFRWTRESGMIGLGVLPFQITSRASVVSGDGSVVLGYELPGEPFRWTEESGMVSLGGFDTTTVATSWNGSVIFGYDAGFDHAVRWSSETGWTYFENVPGRRWPSGGSMSVDGQLFVGSAYFGNYRKHEPRQWTEARGFEMLPKWESTFPWLNDVGPYTSEALIGDLSDDGSVAVGQYRVYDRPQQTEDDLHGVFIWDEEHGFRDLHDLLANNLGLTTEMENWTEEWTLWGGDQAVSYDGRRIVGFGWEQDLTLPGRGWLAILGPPFQPGDANRDDVFNSSDLVEVFVAGEYEDNVADNSLWKDGDWNLDGDFNSSDLVAAFEHGGYVAASTTAIPEPTSAAMLLAGLIGIAVRRRLDVH